MVSSGNTKTTDMKELKIKIDKDIPLPRKQPSHERFKKIFDTVSVGDSFVLPSDEIVAFRRYYTSHRVNLGDKYTTKRIDKNSFRVWRLE